MTATGFPTCYNCEQEYEPLTGDGDGLCGPCYEGCDYAGHDPETEDVGDGVTGLGRLHEHVTTCRRCHKELVESDPDEDGRVEWEVLQ